jgi:hypothetical protein
MYFISSRTVQKLRQGADPVRARPGQARPGISLINTLKGRRRAEQHLRRSGAFGEQLSPSAFPIGTFAISP